MRSSRRCSHYASGWYLFAQLIVLHMNIDIRLMLIVQLALYIDSKKRMHMKNKQSGFSVVEILIVLVVLAGVGGIGWITWQRMQDSNNTKTAQTTKNDSAEVISDEEDAGIDSEPAAIAEEDEE